MRYADDANVYVRSRRAGERVMALLRRLYGKLRLTVNETKSAVTGVFGRKFLGYGLWVAAGGVIKTQGRCQAADDVQAARPTTDLPQWRAQYAGCGGSSAALCSGMEGLLPAGANAEGLARAGSMAASSATRHPAQAVEARYAMYRELLALGAKPDVARQVAANSRRWWRNSGMLLNAVLPLNWSDRLGLPRLS